MIGVAASAPQDNPDLATKVHGFDSTMSSFDSGTLMRAVMEAGDLAAGEEAVVVVADEESEGTDKLVESEKSVESEPIIYPGEVSTLARAVAAESADVSALKHDLRRHLAGIESIGVSDAAKELDDAIPDEPAWSPPQPPAYRANQAKQAASAQLWTGPAKVYATKTVGEKISEETKTREQAAGEFVQAAKTYVRPVVVAPVKAAAPPPRVAVSRIGNVQRRTNLLTQYHLNQAPYPKDMSGRGVAVNPATYKPPSPKSYQRPTVSTPPLSGRTYGTQTKLPLFSDPPGPLPAAVTASYGTWRPPTAVDAVEGIQKGQRLPGESIQPSVAAILQSDTGKFGIDWTVKFAFLPRANDELPLALGDRVWVYRVMRDGFAYGRNINAGLEGWFPVGCLARKM